MNTAADLAEMMLLAGMLLALSLCYSRRPLVEHASRAMLFALLFLMVPLALRGIIWFAVLPVLSTATLTAFIWIQLLIAEMLFLVVLFLLPRMRTQELPLDRGYFASGVLMLMISVLMLSLYHTFGLFGWEFSETVMMASFVVLSLGTGTPYLRRMGHGRQQAYGLILGLVFVFYLPLLITIGIESSGLSFIPPAANLLAYSIIHIGAGSLSAMMAILLFLYSKYRPSWTYYPLVLIFGLWASLSVVLLISFVSPSFLILGEPTALYIVGAILTLVLLHVAARYEKSPPKREVSTTRMLAAFSVCVLLSIIGESVNQLFLLTNPSYIDSLLGEAALLVLSLAVMLAFTYVILLLAKRPKGETSASLYMALLLAIWILPSVLKSYYAVWTLGWWVSEILLLMGIIAGPPILAWLYVKALNESNELYERSSLFADLLMHDVTNYNQMLMTSLELLGSTDLPAGRRARVAADGRQIISFAERLIQNVRLLTETDRVRTADLEPVNLVAAFVAALDYFTKKVGSENVVVEFDPERADCPVLADQHLVHAFLNILYIALEKGIEKVSIKAEIRLVDQVEDDYWAVTIRTSGVPIEAIPDRLDRGVRGRSSLGVIAARRILEHFRGTLIVSDTTDQGKTTYIVQIPVHAN